MKQKVTPIMMRTIRCPRCEKKTLRASVEQVPAFGKEYYCDQCHRYVESYEIYPTSNPNVPEEVLLATTWFDDGTTQVIDEPLFENEEARMEAYKEVDRMFNGIDEWDLDGTTNDGIDFGATHV